MTKSTDLEDRCEVVEKAEDWIQCPHCGSDEVEVSNLSPYSDVRAIVDCQDCPANGFFE